MRSLLLCTLLPVALLAQPVIPNTDVRNAASPFLPIAQGSYASITSYSLAGPIPPDAIVTLTTADGVGTHLTTIVPPSASPQFPLTELWVVIPPSTSLGPAVIAITMNGITYNNSIQIVATAPALFTKYYSGFGPALALNHPSTINGLTTAAVPNSIVSLFATGLNGARTSDVTVEFAGQTIAPLYAGPQGQAGLDQINFALPNNPPLGCYIPVAIRVRGILSNQTTISVNSDPFACGHPLGLSYSDLRTLDAGGNIRLARLTLSRENITTQPWNESAGFTVAVAPAATVAIYSGVQTPASQTFSCYVASLGVAGAAFRGAASVGGGPLLIGKVTLDGPGGKQLNFAQPGFYHAEVPKQDTPYFDGGTWKLSATGNGDVPAFQREFPLPPLLKFTNLNETTVVPSQGYTLHWDVAGFRAGDLVSVSLAANGAYSSCTAAATAGQMDLPPNALENFKGRSTSFSTTVQAQTGQRPVFTIPSGTGPIAGYVEYYFTQQFVAQVQ